jgi:peptidoglycan/LPS O-acetylase OafA/YrhL
MLNAVIGILLLSGIIYGSVDKRLLYHYPALVLSFFVFKPWKYQRYLSGGFIAASTGAGFLFLIIVLYSIGTSPSLDYFAAFLFILPIFYIFNMRKFAESSFCRSRLIEIISYSSYCMYLFHRIAYKGMLSAYNPHNPLPRLLYLFTIGVPVIIVSSYFFQASYDRFLPIFTRGRRKCSK